MDPVLPTMVGLAAGCLGIYGFVPQISKCWRTGETAAISLRMFAVRAFGGVLWTIYGFAVWSLPVLIFSALGLVLISIILVLKIRGSRAEATCEASVREGARKPIKASGQRA
jgi:MtN3 and saliva related transmembrane protein